MNLDATAAPVRPAGDLAARLAAAARERSAGRDPGERLGEVTFVVVDLETTGGSPADCEITEIGAVKVRAGEVVGELQTLVRPAAPIPPFVATLTGITDAMVATAPGPATVLPIFLEFARGTVLVAHNAPFDLGFLRAACVAHGYDWPDFASVDTAQLARRALTAEEVPDSRLASLSRFFRATTTPSHRALADARATVDVLGGLLARVGGLGLQSLGELTDFCTLVEPEQRRRRHLADGLPTTPGVYLFRDAAGSVLHLGAAADVRERVARWFTTTEPRTRMAEMLAAADRVDAVACAHVLEAEILVLRLAAEHTPPYYRWGPREPPVWVRIADDGRPPLSIVDVAGDDDATYLGPFGSRRSAARAVAAARDAAPLPLATVRTTSGSSVAVDVIRAAAVGDPEPVVGAGRRRMSTLRAQGRFDDALVVQDRVAAFVRAAVRQQRAGLLAAVAELVAAAPGADGTWDLVVIRHGRLAAAAVMPGAAVAAPYIALARTAAGPPAGPVTRPDVDETERLLRWLERPGVRLAYLDGVWASPAAGAGRWSNWLTTVSGPGRGGRSRARSWPPAAPVPAPGPSPGAPPPVPASGAPRALASTAPPTPAPPVHVAASGADTVGAGARPLREGIPT